MAVALFQDLVDDAAFLHLRIEVLSLSIVPRAEPKGLR